MKIGVGKKDLDYGTKILEKTKSCNKDFTVLHGEFVFTKMVRDQTLFTLLILLFW